MVDAEARVGRERQREWEVELEAARRRVVTLQESQDRLAADHASDLQRLQQELAASRRRLASKEEEW